ncbi:SDR family oxidoreductase [Mycolicibacterium sp. CH28]|uniref:SDR family oxidoreductase n=1 Tax=Mycolicibacterium sp. CH28 TaxID=2512237 RepID=UPI00107FE1C1|nr:SDR family oxidoreductase [Mycolicibacterium sp. CH28]TGD87875.1 SDR family oxidoreductase [Mycolicibacterium sp. CH28]
MRPAYSALVTGGAGTIGSRISQALSAAGFAVGVGYRDNLSRASRVAENIVNAGGEAIAVPVSLEQPESAIAAVETMAAELAPLGVLVNNAVAWPATVEAAEPFHMDESDWAATVRLNLEGTLHITRHCLRPMTQQGWGRIVTISTNLVDGVMPSDVSYVSGKGGLTAASRALAWEVGPAGVTVNLVAPGLTAEKGATLPEGIVSRIVDGTPIRRLVTSAEVAAAVAFLASPQAGAITGTVLTVSGGH